MVLHIIMMEESTVPLSSCIAEAVVPRKPLKMVMRPAMIEAANAAVGFGCVLVANSYLTYGMRAKSIKRL